MDKPTLIERLIAAQEFIKPQCQIAARDIPPLLAEAASALAESQERLTAAEDALKLAELWRTGYERLALAGKEMPSLDELLKRQQGTHGLELHHDNWYELINYTNTLLATATADRAKCKELETEAAGLQEWIEHYTESRQP